MKFLKHNIPKRKIMKHNKSKVTLNYFKILKLLEH